MLIITTPLDILTNWLLRVSSAATNSDEEDSGESSTDGSSDDNEEYNDPERYGNIFEKACMR